MAAKGKIVKVKVRPSQSADLAVGVGGIVEGLRIPLGKPVSAFDFVGFCAHLGTTSSGSPGRLDYDSNGIQNHQYVGQSLVLALRAESVAAILDKAILSRENAYFAKYGHKADIVHEMNTQMGSSGQKPSILDELHNMSLTREQLLQDAYSADGLTEVVVKSTSSDMVSEATTTGESITGNRFAEWDSTYTSGQAKTNTTGEDDGTAAVPLGLDKDGHPVNFVSPLRDTSHGEAVEGSTSQSDASIHGTGETITTGHGESKQVQSMTNTSFDYRVPSLESAAQDARAQISLIDEQFDQRMASLVVPNLQKVLENELAIIDLEVKVMQVAYLNTMLLSPIDGIVTGVYKNPGESARAGEVLARVENNQTILLDGIIVYRGSINIGDTVTVQTTLFSDPSKSTSISGAVVAARGHQWEDDW